MDLFSLMAATLRISAPLILVGMAGLLSYQVGLINIALEGMMLAGAFAAVVISFEIGSTWVGVLGAACCGALLGAFFAVSVITLRANLIVAGLALNFLVIGATAYLMEILYSQSGTLAPEGLTKLPRLTLPLIDDMPVIGKVFPAIHHSCTRPGCQFQSPRSFSTARSLASTSVQWENMQRPLGQLGSPSPGCNMWR
jgi:ABC-type uncharacterized transport system permease subunit